MKRHTDSGQEKTANPALEAFPPVILLDDEVRPLPRARKDHWRLSQSAKPLRTWRLSK
jgi:hypothetical protein